MMGSREDRQETEMNKRNVAISIILLMGLLLAFSAVAALAQGGAAVSHWWVIASGGGPTGNGSVAFNDTLGQPFVGSSSAENVSLAAGYWHAAGGGPEPGATYFFPIIMKGGPS